MVGAAAGSFRRYAGSNPGRRLARIFQLYSSFYYFFPHLPLTKPHFKLTPSFIIVCLLFYFKTSAIVLPVLLILFISIMPSLAYLVYLPPVLPRPASSPPFNISYPFPLHSISLNFPFFCILFSLLSSLPLPV